MRGNQTETKTITDGWSILNGEYSSKDDAWKRKSSHSIGPTKFNDDGTVDLEIASGLACRYLQT